MQEFFIDTNTFIHYNIQKQKVIPMKDTILFDLDGTLVNSIADLCDASNYMLKKLSLPQRSLEEIQSFVGNGIDVLVKLSIGENIADLNEAMSYFREYYNKNMCKKTKPYSGIITAIDTLIDKGFKLAVVSNKAQDAAEEITRHFFGSRFSAITGADTARRPKKPDPAPLDHTLNILRSTRDRAIYIGDSEVDIKTAHNSNITFIGVTWGFRPEEIFTTEMYKASAPSELVSLCCNFL